MSTSRVLILHEFIYDDDNPEEIISHRVSELSDEVAEGFTFTERPQKSANLERLGYMAGDTRAKEIKDA